MNVSRIMGVALSDEQVKTLLSGKKILLKGLTSKGGKKYDAYIIPNGIEDYSYMKDGEKKSGKQFKFAMDCNGFPKKGNRNVLLLCVQICIMRMIKGNTTILEGVLCYGNKNS